MRTCIIGGGGFIGSYLTKALLDSGREVIALGRSTNRPSTLHNKADYLSCDYSNRVGLRNAITGCDEIVDLAYATIPKTSFENPVFDLQSNLLPSVTLLEEARDHDNLKRLIIVSSGGTVYGTANRLPIIEEDNTAPISPYGITKLTIERYALMFQRLNGVPATIVRPANAYGIGQKPFTGQGFIATAMGQILMGKDVTIFGKDGTIRDYIHVQDIATGISNVLEHGLDGEIYNIGSGIGRSNRDVINTIIPLAEQEGYTVNVNSTSPRSFDVPANILSYGKLLNCSGWKPQISFEAGITQMWEAFISKN